MSDCTAKKVLVICCVAVAADGVHIAFDTVIVYVTGPVEVPRPVNVTVPSEAVIRVAGAVMGAGEMVTV